MADIIQLRRDTAANWVTVNPVLADGEIGIETDTRKRKCGNGTTAWNLLPYMFSDDLDAQPTANSHKPVESGGTKAAIDAAILNNGKGAFDISAYKSVDGVLAKFDDLAQALGTNGANVPAAARKPGMSACFVLNYDNKYVQYRLAASIWSTDIHDWTSEDPYFIDKIMQEVNEVIDENKPIEIHGNVTNAPDEEDLTSVNVGGTDVLKFKDKAYNQLNYSGMGRKILRKNIVSGVNTLTQSMINQTNTIYVIQYDFTLGEDITIPENCVLKFDGGSIIGKHAIAGQNTIIDAMLVKIFDTNISIVGSWNITEAYPEWFGAKGDGVTDDSTFIEKCINIFKLTCFSSEKTYFVNNIIVKTSSSNIDGKGCYLKSSDNVEYIFDLANNNIDYGTKFIRNFNCYDTITGSSRYIFRINNIVGTIFENINIGSHSLGLCYIENNTWSLQFKNCNLNGYNTASTAVCVPANNQNSGERISFSNCTLGNYNTAIKISGTNLSFFFTNCSFDYNTNYILKEEGSNINSYSFVNCHFEANFTVEPFNTESLFTRVFINNCAIIFNKKYDGNFFYNCKASLENCYGNWANYISDKINANIHNVNPYNVYYYSC